MTTCAHGACAGAPGAQDKHSAADRRRLELQVMKTAWLEMDGSGSVTLPYYRKAHTKNKGRLREQARQTRSTCTRHRCRVIPSGGDADDLPTSCHRPRAVLTLTTSCRGRQQRNKARTRCIVLAAVLAVPVPAATPFTWGARYGGSYEMKSSLTCTRRGMGRHTFESSMRVASARLRLAIFGHNCVEPRCTRARRQAFGAKTHERYLLVCG